MPNTSKSTQFSNHNFSDKLLTWFEQYGRKDLPWQENKTPYRVWVSEIMLQQTQVSSVIEYYQRFMRSFPNLRTLADADEDKVLEHWAGLGYYARARNLHKAAKFIRDEYNAIFPDNYEQIVELSGIGRSTAGAILSIAFKQPACILDGNVKRVLARVHAIDRWPGEKKTENELWQIAEQYTPTQRTDEYTQAIMDLGATLCTRSKPKCPQCPMTENCLAFAQELQTTLPVSKPKKAIPQKQTWVALIESDKGELLLEKRPPTGIWGSLYSLPEFSPEIDEAELLLQCEQRFGGKFELLEKHQSIHHVFSHFKLELKPVKLKMSPSRSEINEASSFYWFEAAQLNNIALPSPISKYLRVLTEAKRPPL